MGAVALLGVALRLSSPPIRRRGLALAMLWLSERLLTPGLAYAFVVGGLRETLTVGITLGATVGLRSATQQSLMAYAEADLHKRAVLGVLGRDALERQLLPDDEGAVSLFQSVHRIAVLLADTLPSLIANVGAACALMVAGCLLEPAPIVLSGAAAVAVAGLALFYFRQWVSKSQIDAWTAWEDVVDGITDACGGRMDIIAGGTDDEFMGRFVRTTMLWDSKARHAARTASLAGRLPLLLPVALASAAVIGRGFMHREPLSVTTGHALLLASVAPTFLAIARCVQELLSNEQRLLLVARVERRAEPRPDPEGPLASPSRVTWSAIRFAYPATNGEALRGVTFDWRRGQVLALTGANGSGKSACLGVMLGLGTVRGGSILVDDVPLPALNVRAWRRRISFLPQRPYLGPQSSLRTCLEFVDRNIPEATMREALERVGLLGNRQSVGDLLDLRVSQLSIGERQRVALARMLCRSAPLVVLDEPDANLDASGIRMVSRIIRDLARDHMVLYVAHTADLLAVADRVVTLEGGVVQSDSTKSVASNSNSSLCDS